MLNLQLKGTGSEKVLNNHLLKQASKILRISRLRIYIDIASFMFLSQTMENKIKSKQVLGGRNSPKSLL